VARHLALQGPAHGLSRSGPRSHTRLAASPRAWSAPPSSSTGTSPRAPASRPSAPGPSSSKSCWAISPSRAPSSPRPSCRKSSGSRSAPGSTRARTMSTSSPLGLRSRSAPG
jgi:hypothetical protein